jgi:hypothetical protein
MPGVLADTPSDPIVLVLSAAVLVLVIDRLSSLAVWRFPPRLANPSFDSVVRDSRSPSYRYGNPTGS